MNAVAHPCDLALLTGPALVRLAAEVAPLLLRMGDADSHLTVDHIITRVLDGSMQFWLVRKHGRPVGAWLTEIVVYPKKRLLVFTGCVGDGLKEWNSLRAQILDWGRDQGCVSAIAACRAGFARFWPEAKRTLVVMELPL